MQQDSAEDTIVEDNNAKTLHRPHNSPEPIRNGKSAKPREGDNNHASLRTTRVTSKIAANGPLIAPPPAAGDSLSPTSSRHLRLYQAAKEQQAKLDALRLKAKEAELGRSASASRRSASPLTSTDERADTNKRDRFHHAEERVSRQELAKQEQLRSRTQLASKRSTTPLAAKRVTSSFDERMRESDQRISQHIQHLKEEQLQRETKECTFRPQLKTRPQSAGPLKGRNSKQPNVPVHERLSAHAAMLQKKKEDAIAKKKEEEAKEFDFKPKLLTSPPKRSPEQPADDIYTRLSSEAEILKAKKAALCESAEKEQMKDCSFSPQIPTYHNNNSDDPTVSSISGATSVFDRLSVPQSHQHYSSEETFQPKLNAKAKAVPLRRAPEEAALPVYDRLLLHGNRQKEQRLANEKRRREEEQQECTFTPHISATPDGGIWKEHPDAAKPLSRSSSPTRSTSPVQASADDVFHRLHLLKTDSFSAKLVTAADSTVTSSTATTPLRKSISPSRKNVMSPPRRNQISASPPPTTPSGGKQTQLSPKPSVKSRTPTTPKHASAAAFDPSKVIKRKPKEEPIGNAELTLDVTEEAVSQTPPLRTNENLNEEPAETSVNAEED